MTFLEKTMISEASGYFLYHSIGQYPGKADALAQAMAEFAQVWGAADDAQWGYALGTRARFVDRWRAIIGAAQGTVTTCENVTQGLHMLITALPEGYLRGNVIKYLARYPEKGGGLDLLKARHYLEKLLEEVDSNEQPVRKPTKKVKK